MSIVIGTAGHIDHGKTALVRALTGIETDRLKEERERGISIDLGFAHFDTDDGERAGVVDVPGHERFIRNMIAGAHGIDLVLLVVAADDGVMPQTEEHLDILHLLGVRHGIVVMTKIDLVDAPRRAAVRDEIALLVAGTTLDGAPVCEVSATTGAGVAALAERIRAHGRAAVRPAPAGSFRLPIDRVFSMRGHGLVVTGTAIAGQIAADASVRIQPGDHAARVRGLQVHGAAAARAWQGQRIALNLAGVDRADIGRGHVVCGAEWDQATACVDARVELRPAARPLANHARVRVHLGTAEAIAKIIWLDGRAALATAQHTYAQLVLRAPLLACGGDRFVLRDENARRTIGGGIVLHPFAAPSRRRPDGRVAALARVDQATAATARLLALLDLESSFAVAPERLATSANVTVDAVGDALAHDPRCLALPDATDAQAYTTADKWHRLRRAVERVLADFHAAQPRQRGMEMESLRSQLASRSGTAGSDAATPRSALHDTSAKVFRAVVARLEHDGVLARDGSIVRLPAHRVDVDAAEERLAGLIMARLDAGRFMPPDVAELSRTLAVSRPQLAECSQRLEREGALIRASPDLWFSAAAVAAARDLIRAHAAVHGQIDAATFRNLIGASRKFSIALLNYFDRTGFTLRVGDVRKLRQK